jgi:hypothetical protein
MVNPAMKNLRKWLSEMTQLQWDKNTKDQLRCDKYGEDGLPSPNLADATLQAFQYERSAVNPGALLRAVQNAPPMPGSYAATFGYQRL